MTTIKPVHRDLVEAIAARNLIKARELNEAMPPEEHQAYSQYLSAVFSLLLDDFFGTGLSRDSIAGFANQLREDYRDSGVPFNRLAVEGVIRASAGETSLFEDLTSEDIVSTQVMVIGKLGTQGTAVRPDLDRFLDEAEVMVAEWEQEDQ